MRCWLQDTGFRLFDTGFRLFDTGFRLFDTGFRLFDTGFRLFDTSGFLLWLPILRSQWKYVAFFVAANGAENASNPKPEADSL
jgi:hypothetical protein